jgi:HEAT repeat protein
VLLTAFNDRGTGELMKSLLTDRNDRIREVAYRWFAQHPDPAMGPTLVAALQTELAEFVRPALVSALAALGNDPQVQRALISEAGRGLDFFRIAVIEALGERQAKYAADAILEVAKVDGPLQDDAVLALARIGDARVTSIIPPGTNARADTAAALSGAACSARTAPLR